MNPATRRTRSNRGFTAIEITAVATIIAILALLLIPLLQERVEKAKLAAAGNDLNQLMKAQMLVFADTNHYARLQDLDNTKFNDTTSPQPEIAIPRCFWNIPMTAKQRNDMLSRGKEPGQWNGPYLAFNSVLTVQQLLAVDSGVFFWGEQGAGGPILLTADDNVAMDRYPVDPWRGPYLFFGPHALYVDTDWQAVPANAPKQVPLMVNGETDFQNCAIYSLGPDGRPGNNQGLTTDNLRRAKGVLGDRTDPKSDDLMVQF